MLRHTILELNNRGFLAMFSFAPNYFRSDAKKIVSVA
jgi:hypothetical protein